MDWTKRGDPPGVHIGSGAIIGVNSVVGSDVAPYTKVVGNPARAIQKRFDDELIELLLKFKWWDKSADEINRLIPILACSNLDKAKAEIKSNWADKFRPINIAKRP